MKCPQDSFNKLNFKKDGVSFRKSDSKTIQKYRCCFCGKSGDHIFNILRIMVKRTKLTTYNLMNIKIILGLFINSFLTETIKASKGLVVRTGELKKLKRDPLFMINHIWAMLRASINRPIRKTWCATKDLEMLQKYLDISSDFHKSI